MSENRTFAQSVEQVMGGTIVMFAFPGIASLVSGIVWGGFDIPIMMTFEAEAVLFHLFFVTRLIGFFMIFRGTWAMERKLRASDLKTVSSAVKVVKVSLLVWCALSILTRILALTAQSYATFLTATFTSCAQTLALVFGMLMTARLAASAGKHTMAPYIAMAAVSILVVVDSALFEMPYTFTAQYVIWNAAGVALGVLALVAGGVALARLRQVVLY